jgi:hypothetical protein
MFPESASAAGVPALTDAIRSAPEGWREALVAFPTGLPEPAGELLRAQKWIIIERYRGM